MGRFLSDRCVRWLLRLWPRQNIEPAQRLVLGHCRGRPQQDPNLRSRLRRRQTTSFELVHLACSESITHLPGGQAHSAYFPDHGIFCRDHPQLGGMARVRSGQAAAWPLVSDRCVRSGSGVKRDFACTLAGTFPPVLVALRAQSRLGLEGWIRTLSGPSLDLTSSVSECRHSGLGRGLAAVIWAYARCALLSYLAAARHHTGLPSPLRRDRRPWGRARRLRTVLPMETQSAAIPVQRCWELLATASVGRLALSVRALPMIRPVQYYLSGNGSRSASVTIRSLNEPWTRRSSRSPPTRSIPSPGPAGKPMHSLHRSVDTSVGVRTRSDQSVTSGAFLLAVHGSLQNREVVRPCGSQPGSAPGTSAPWSWPPLPCLHRCADRATALPRPLPRTRLVPDSRTDGFSQGRLRVYISHPPSPRWLSYGHSRA